ncbi:Inactive protein RESTRICTED TEV MOVEMENT 2, partial [Mucuna pruriens]
MEDSSRSFPKERIKINYVRSSRAAKVVGERPLGGNRVSKFEQAYPVPENCEEEKLQGKYERGTLIITMPKKKSISQVSPQTQVEATNKKGPSPTSPSKKLVPEPKPKEVAMPPKSPTPRMEQGEKSNRDKRGPQNIQEETMLKSSTTTTIASTPPKEIGKSQKGQEEIEPKVTSTMGARKQIEDKHEEEMKHNETYIKNFKMKFNESVREKEVKEDGKAHEARKQPDQKYINHHEILKEKEIKPRPKEERSSSPKAQEKGKEDETYTIGKGIKEVVASASEVVTRIGEGKLNDEEKPLVANMGAAILVIAALGAYITYKFTSSTRL